MTQSASDIPEIIFFLGAGASVEAGIPDTRSFIFGRENSEDCFIGYLKNKGFQKEGDILKKIFSSLDENKRNIIDVELVLQILHELNDRTDNHVHHFYEQSTFKFKSLDDIQSLKRTEELLRKFIREKVLANVDKIDYLSPLLSFQKPLIIFSVNYDTCIESLSLKHKLSYTDGFELNWQPDLFDKNFDIKLFKLHGSIIWYQTNSGNYLKLPVTQDKIQLITGEIAQPFLLYPMKSKGQFAESLSFLSTQLQLYLKTAKICVVVGYSFRDEDIRRIFFEMAKNNNSLTVLLISPNAGEIFKSKLEFYDIEKKIPSPLSEKVICWNYSFGPVLNDYYLYQHLQPKITLLRKIYSQAENARIEGNNDSSLFIDCIFQAALPLDDIKTIERILKRELGVLPEDYDFIFDEKKRFEILYSLGILSLLNSDDNANLYFHFFVKFLKEIKEFGLEYIHLNQEKTESANLLNYLKKTNDENSDEIRDALKKYHAVENKCINFETGFPKKDFAFYYWPMLDSDFFKAISGLQKYIREKIELQPQVNEKVEVLQKIEKTCLDIKRRSHSGRNDAKVAIGNQLVNDKTIEVLPKLLDLLIQQIELLIKK